MLKIMNCVLEGSGKLLDRGYIRDIVYEDLKEYPSVTLTILSMELSG